MYKYTSNNLEWFLRIPLIGTFLYHGYPKLGVEVANLGFTGYLVGPFEFFGAIFLIIGPIFYKELEVIGSLMIAIIMIGAIYMHLFKWNDTLKDVEWQILIVGVSLFLSLKDSKFLKVKNE